MGSPELLASVLFGCEITISGARLSRLHQRGHDGSGTKYVEILHHVGMHFGCSLGVLRKMMQYDPQGVW